MPTLMSVIFPMLLIWNLSRVKSFRRSLKRPREVLYLTSLEALQPRERLLFSNLLPSSTGSGHTRFSKLFEINPFNAKNRSWTIYCICFIRAMRMFLVSLKFFWRTWISGRRIKGLKWCGVSLCNGFFKEFKRDNISRHLLIFWSILQLDW